MNARLPADWWLVFAAWLVAATATLGALFFGEVMGLPPCLLCWYQRICMFPLALILPLGLAAQDRHIVRYALPLAMIGLAIALFHQALVSGWVPKSLEPCARGVPCSKTVVEWFGFLTLPWLSIAAFAAIVLLLTLAFRQGRR
ncbi:disulfide bond formation protein B [Sulfuricystis multivorans]|uniref:disulfide bond formation protein B n=1 Tax=Sulfuricystis multivorans TaxID=2211108 RepID=UPI000F82B513|nr:disulfide bond formation protein B [Sulfuricystis multivorans]